jgi:hypothetical protein
VKDRSGKIKGAAMEVKQIIEDYQMQAIGGLAAARDLWERALVPSLLAGSGTWIGNIQEAIKLCDSIQGFYWKIILKVPDSCPKLAIRCEGKIRSTKWRIWEEKCLLLLRIQNLEDGSLAKNIYLEAEANNWPGLGREVKDICQQPKIQDLNKYRLTKQEIQQAIEKSHQEDMLSQFDHSSKLEDIKNSDFSNFQAYFRDKNIENARTKFKIRSKMLEKIPGNFRNKYKNIQDCLKCIFCIEDMTQSHSIVCPGRKEQRRNLDMTNLDDLVTYFNDILNQ